MADILGSQRTERYAAILLNQPILPPFKDLIARIWSNGESRGGPLCEREKKIDIRYAHV